MTSQTLVSPAPKRLRQDAEINLDFFSLPELTLLKNCQTIPFSYLDEHWAGLVKPLPLKKAKKKVPQVVSFITEQFLDNPETSLIRLHSLLLTPKSFLDEKDRIPLDLAITSLLVIDPIITSSVFYSLFHSIDDSSGNSTFPSTTLTDFFGLTSSEPSFLFYFHFACIRTMTWLYVNSTKNRQVFSKILLFCLTLPNSGYLIDPFFKKLENVFINLETNLELTNNVSNLFIDFCKFYSSLPAYNEQSALVIASKAFSILASSRQSNLIECLFSLDTSVLNSLLSPELNPFLIKLLSESKLDSFSNNFKEISNFIFKNYLKNQFLYLFSNLQNNSSLISVLSNPLVLGFSSNQCSTSKGRAVNQSILIDLECVAVGLYSLINIFSVLNSYSSDLVLFFSKLIDNIYLDYNNNPCYLCTVSNIFCLIINLLFDDTCNLNPLFTHVFSILLDFSCKLPSFLIESGHVSHLFSSIVSLSFVPMKFLEKSSEFSSFLPCLFSNQNPSEFATYCLSLIDGPKFRQRNGILVTFVKNLVNSFNYKVKSEDIFINSVLNPVRFFSSPVSIKHLFNFFTYLAEISINYEHGIVFFNDLVISSYFYDLILQFFNSKSSELEFALFMSKFIPFSNREILFSKFSTPNITNFMILQSFLKNLNHETISLLVKDVLSYNINFDGFLKYIDQFSGDPLTFEYKLLLKFSRTHCPYTILHAISSHITTTPPNIYLLIFAANGLFLHSTDASFEILFERFLNSCELLKNSSQIFSLSLIQLLIQSIVLIHCSDKCLKNCSEVVKSFCFKFPQLIPGLLKFIQERGLVYIQKYFLDLHSKLLPSDRVL
ncbi:hypothetical protein RCL1_003738 [Eukaryota sp. TZLM3-RCL]